MISLDKHFVAFGSVVLLLLSVVVFVIVVGGDGLKWELWASTRAKSTVA
jgi:hypothetical protein